MAIPQLSAHPSISQSLNPVINRRDFLGLAAIAGIAAPSLNGALYSKTARSVRHKIPRQSLDDLVEQCRTQLFDEYLPFWEHGGLDREHGGILCYLFDDGAVENDRKDIWYQGRAIWVYSYLHNEIDPKQKWLDEARHIRDFMVAHMHQGDGTWLDTVNRTGEPVDGIAVDRDGTIYGALFAAVGLIQYAQATGSQEDLDLAELSLRKSIECYEDRTYRGGMLSDVQATGLRAQGVSFMLVWILPQLIALDPDTPLRHWLRAHLHTLERKFWNPEYGISNESLFHDYSRIPRHANRMVPGHSIEAQWMCLDAARRFDLDSDPELFQNRMLRLIEMSWDYPFSGVGDTAYNVFKTKTHPAGPDFETKTMWAQTEVAIGCLLAFAHSGNTQALQWFDRSWEFLQRTMTTPHGVWRQAVNRKGEDKQRAGISIYRKGNFHQPRALMYIIRLATQLKSGKRVPIL